ncbi:MAG: amylo-alpha-1,6-glucosidase [Candidatus Sumerlaeaceae bacterium]|nr:amylo-alpha-1,6-glucosidase [Candidatus Sumerlaeaceae bacterium]
MGTTSGIRTRRYHALLLIAQTPPTSRVVLVNGLDAWLETPGGAIPLTSQYYAPGVTHPEGAKRIKSFSYLPWPTWELDAGRKITVTQELFVAQAAQLTAIRWTVKGAPKGSVLCARPFLSGRDYHILHHENPDFSFDSGQHGPWTLWQPYSDLPVIGALTNATYVHQPLWYRSFHYLEEERRGLDDSEDLGAPGTLRWNAAGECYLLLAARRDRADFDPGADAAKIFMQAREKELSRRSAFSSPLERAADAFIVRRGEGKTIVAGYPWFTDWGRDTFISMRGLCLAQGHLEDARQILVEWAGSVSGGMLPNRFTDAFDEPEFNSVDASLWFIVAVHDFLEACKKRGVAVSESDRAALIVATEQILTGYSRGTRHQIKMDSDGLIAAGEPGVQLTWMDAKVKDWVVTPRIGKPVEIQALWINALEIGSMFSEKWKPLAVKARASFAAKFFDEKRGYLADVVDADHVSGETDWSFRPNQLFAIGGLPFPLLEGKAARRVVDLCEAKLMTPLGPRTLAPDDPNYCPVFHGGIMERDGAYHRGTAWAWLTGPFVEAWVRVRGGTETARAEARARFVEPLLAHMEDCGLGSITEVADGDPPYRPGGCPFQAWSVAEVIRLLEDVLVEK